MNAFEQGSLSREDEFERKKQQYFTRLALSFRSAFRLHRDAGLLWERDQSRRREWRNVSEHCLVEGARVGILADLLFLSPQARKDLVFAALLHDFFKRNEIENMKEAATSGRPLREASLSSDQEGKVRLQAAQVPKNIIRLVGAAGNHPETIFEIKTILDKEELTEDDLSFLTMHYIDDYTKGDMWVTPVEMDKEHSRINDIDRRLREGGQRYAKKMEEEETAFRDNPDPFFHNKKGLQIISEIAHMVERRLADLVSERSGEAVDPLELPEIIDNVVREAVKREVLE